MIIHPLDNVEVREDGHKYALRDIPRGAEVIKYGMPIGHATQDIPRGAHVHVHNLATNLAARPEYTYEPVGASPFSAIMGFARSTPPGPCGATPLSEGGKTGGKPPSERGVAQSAGGSIPCRAEAPKSEMPPYEPVGTWLPGAASADPPTFPAYRRPDGRIGIRNDLWVVPTVGCVNALCERLAASCGGFALTHPFGCSQLGEDHEATARLLAALCRHPNVGGVLVVALGCENNTLESFRERLGDTSGLNIRFLRAQDPGDEFERGRALLAELAAKRVAERTPASAAELVVGLKCGGSDGFSGLTANPLVGRFSDWLVARGGSAVLTEVPEMFGAETLLLNRCRSREVFDRCVAMVDGFRAYYERHGQPCWENPSPGNRAGGITTLEDKSLGCVQKGGTSPVVDVLEYGGRVRERGLTLLSAPGNDLVSATALAAAGCHLVLFTTGRGTPFGTVVPTVKIATNSALAAAKPHWIDWDAMSNGDVDAFARKVLSIAAGEPAANERTGSRGIAIWKDGVVL